MPNITVYSSTALLGALGLCAAVFVGACKNEEKQANRAEPPVPAAPVAPPAPVVAPPPVVGQLAWEKEHPERAAWTAGLNKLVNEHFAVLDKATDIGLFCAKYASLTDEQKKLVWASFLVEVAFLESDFNAGAFKVDVGTPSDKATWSTGLFQVSAVDSANWRLPFSYTFDELLIPENNMRLAVALMAKQVERKKVLVGARPLYWAVLGDKDFSRTQVPLIIEKVSALPFCK